MSKPSSTRIYGIIARDAPVAVIFRRGPSKQVCLIKWNLRTDKLEYGQWFKGRIYERRCDLSPSGKYLIYFAASYKVPLYSWTAISKPPYLTALALWKKGDGWGGGGAFDSELRIRLNHRPAENKLAEGFKLRKGMRTLPFGKFSGRGEDDPINFELQTRDGWELVASAVSNPPDFDANVAWEFTEPAIFGKTSKKKFRLLMFTRGVSQKNDSWYWIDHKLIDDDQKLLLDLPRTDWANFDHNGDLLFARNGKLFRLAEKNFPKYAEQGDDVLKLVADLSGLKFEEIVAPKHARTW
jgi:hypothetical protein